MEYRFFNMLEFGTLTLHLNLCTATATVATAAVTATATVAAFCKGFSICRAAGYLGAGFNRRFRENLKRFRSVYPPGFRFTPCVGLVSVIIDNA